MLYIAIVLIVVLLGLRVTGPKMYAVHASVLQELPDDVRPEGHWLPGIVRSAEGGYFDVDHRFVGHAVRGSMASFGIPDRSKFVGDFLDDAGRSRLSQGDIVVLECDGETDGDASETGLCLRRVDHVDGQTISFMVDSYNRPHASARLADVVVRVTHVIRPAPIGSLPRWVSRLMQKKAA